jgi:hypothetical protein
MALRSGHGNGASTPRIEVLPPGKHRCRIDFAIVGFDGAPWLACEVDGVAYHSSKEPIS